ncbi:MAG: hypothetical protein U0R78_05555 [Nocardioidaceae bacterium]
MGIADLALGPRDPPGEARSSTSSAAAISATVRPLTSRSVSGTRVSSASAGGNTGTAAGFVVVDDAQRRLVVGPHDDAFPAPGPAGSTSATQSVEACAWPSW